MNRVFGLTRSFDWWLVLPTAYLVVLGLVIQSSILLKTKGLDVDYKLTAHFAAIAGAFAVAIFASYFKPNSWKKFFVVSYVLSLVILLFLALSGGEDVARWLEIAGVRFQPTEITKLITIGVLGTFLANSLAKSDGLKTALASLGLVVLPAVLIAMQPALGSALVFMFIWLTILVSSPVRLRVIFGISISAIVLVLLILPLLKPYQKNRITSFLNPGDSSQEASYNSIQAGIAIGSGGLTGNGLESGSQSQLNFLPAQHTDFAFAVTSEKLGLIGASTIIIALAALMIRMSYLAWLTNNLYWRLLLMGLVGMFLAHTLVNIGMNVGLLPVTGLPLPFISYGGTFLLVCLSGVFLAMILSYWIVKEVADRG